jgi:FHA domain-containing protein
MIEIYVLTFADLTLDKPQSMVFSDKGGSIGRSQENTMVLLDSERLVSRIQARIDMSEESYVIENLSSTSTIFVGETELGKRKQAVLNDGAEIRIGLYVLGVRFIENPKQGSLIESAHTNISTSGGRLERIPVDDPLSLFGSTGSSNISNPFGDLICAPSTNTSVEQVSNFSGFESDVPELSKEVPYKRMSATIPEDFNAFSLPSAVKRNTDNPLTELDGNNSISLKGIYEINESTDKLVDHGVLRYDLNANDLHKDDSTKMFLNMLNADPMAMFDDAPSLLPNNNLEPQYTLPNHGSELRASFTKLQNKTASSDNEAIQDINEILSDIRIVDANKIPNSKINEAPNLIVQDDSYETKSITSLLSNQNGSELNPNKSNTVDSTVVIKHKIPKTTLPHVTTTSSKNIHPKVKTVSVSDMDTPMDTPVNDDLLKAFLSGAGVAGTPLVNQLDAGLMAKLGQMLQICVSGAVDLIQARAATKREFRSEVTMIVTKGNNPLKFSPDGQAAMLQLLGKPFPGFIPAIPALQDTFDDLRAHEVGMIVGTRAALHEVLNRFSPDELEKRLTTPTFMQTILPSQRKAHLWRMYNELFQKIFDEAENDFQTLYGKAFRDAYEDEVERLKSKIKE